MRVSFEIDGVRVRKQFARDIPSLVRVNGVAAEGSTDHEKILTTYQAIRLGTHGRNEEIREVRVGACVCACVRCCV